MSDLIPELPIRLREHKGEVIFEANPIGFCNSTEKQIVPTKELAIAKAVEAIETWYKLNKL